MGQIKINERFSIERDAECWTLTEYRYGVNQKTGEPTIGERRRWFPNLHTTVDFMLDLCGSEADGLTSLRSVFMKCREDIIAALRRG